MEKISENEIVILKSVVPLFAIVILFVLVGQFGFGKISDIRNQITKANNDHATLIQKLNILDSLSQNGAQIPNSVSAALPSDNPALLAMAQIEILAQSQGLILTQLKVSGPGTDVSGLSVVAITFNVVGSRAQIESFMTKINTFAPITILDKFSISEEIPGITSGSISVKSFWADYPTKVPPVTQAISNLTPDENIILQDVENLAQPVFTHLPAASNGGRTDPFNP